MIQKFIKCLNAIRQLQRLMKDVRCVARQLIPLTFDLASVRPN